MSVDKLKKMIKENSFDTNVFLLFGQEEFLKSHYKKQLIEKLQDEMMPELNTFFFDGKNYKIADVDEAIESLPVMADKKLLVFEDSLIFVPDSRTGSKQEYRDYWDKRIKDIPDYVNIIFVESKIDKRSGLYKYVTKNYLAAEIGYLDENEMIRWTVGLFKTMGKKISPHDARYLVTICDDGMMAVKREAEKISAYAQDRSEVHLEEIKLLVTPSIENKVFEMIDAIVNKNIDFALEKLNDLFALKENEVKILGAMIYNVDKLINTKLLLEKGADKSDIMSALKVAPFAATKYMKDCAKYSYEDLSALMQRCTQTDLQLKSNSIDNKILLEILLAESI